MEPHVLLSEISAKHFDGLEVLAVCTEAPGYNATGLQETQTCVGSKAWSVFTKSNRLDVLEREVRDLKEDVKDLKKENKLLKTDALDNGTIKLQLTATQAYFLQQKTQEKVSQTSGSISY